MATSAFKSTTKRTPVIGTPPSATTTDDYASSSTKTHRRSRSLSQFSRRLPELDSDGPAALRPRGKFVNTVRGSGFPDISLDDLAIEFFPLKKDVVVESESSSRSRPFRRDSQISAPTESSQRRGRSVSRHNGAPVYNDVNNTRRRRSVSVARDSDGNGRAYISNYTAGSGDESARSVYDVNSRRRSVSVVRNRISDSDGNGRAYNSNYTAGSGGDSARSVYDANSRRRRSVSVVRNHISDFDGNGRGYNDLSGNGGSRAVPDGNSRRRRSVSVARHRTSSYESDIDHSGSTHSERSLSRVNGPIASLQKPTQSTHRRLGRSLSHMGRLRSHDGYSSQSSAVTDDDSRDPHQVEKTIRAVYSQKTDHPTEDDVNSGLFEKMKKELRSAVDGIRIELEQAMVRKSSALTSHDHLMSDKYGDFDAVSAIRNNYAAKVKQSDQRKQELLAAMSLEEQRGKELSKIVKELLPDSKSSAIAEKSSQTRKRSNDRSKMSKRLNEEAEKYFEDFISNVEDTDFSSFDGERSDATSSSLSGVFKSRNGVLKSEETGNYRSPVGCNSVPVEMEGVNLPWLKWETNNDVSPLSSNSKTQLPVTPKTLLWDAAQDVSLIQEPSNHSTSSDRSWIPEILNGYSTNKGEESSSKSSETVISQGSRFDADVYFKLKRNEDLLFESWKQRNRISSGGLLLCGCTL